MDQEPQTVVRMGELSVSSTPGHVLTSIGLGSCIGLVLLEPARPLAGLAHIVLPTSNGRPDPAGGRFADQAVPALLEQMALIGALRSRLQAVLAGGAQIIAAGGSSLLDIGGRNERAAREALEQSGVAVEAAATGGRTGRTLRVYVGSGVVTVREPGEPEVEIFSNAAIAGRSR
jgi:chemotaxis protein CheD